MKGEGDKAIKEKNLKKRTKKSTGKESQDKSKGHSERTIKETKMNKVLQENRKLKEKLYYLESSVSALNAMSANKEDKYQVELKVQNDLEKALEKKMEELQNAFEESDKCKTASFDRIIELERQCQNLKKKIVLQDHELSSFKFKYNELKKLANF